MTISWSNKMINDLSSIVNYFNTNEIGESINKLENYFIEKHQTQMVFSHYFINFSENTYPLTADEHKLAFVCEISNTYENKSKMYYSLVDNKRTKKEKNNFKNVYNWVSFMIKYCILKLLKLENRMGYNDFFLTTLIKEKILPFNVLKDKNDPIVNITNFSYFLTRRLIELCDDKEKEIYKNSSLIADTQNLDISICSPKEIREICNVLKTKRTLFARILLILSFEISKININDPLWLTRYINLDNYTDFVSIISSSLIESMIFISCKNI